MSLLSIVQTFAKRTGLPVPATASGSRDAQVIQIAALLEEVLEDLTDRRLWSGLAVEAVFTTVEGEDQGPISALAPKGFLWIINDTLFSRSGELLGSSPLSPSEWQQLKAFSGARPFPSFRLRNGHLWFSSPMTAGKQYAFEYASSWAVRKPDGGLNSTFTSDADEVLFPEPLLVAGLRWKWKAEKGLDYAEEFRRYEGLVANAAGRDAGGGRILSMNSPCDPRPGILVPAGSWKIP